MKNYLITFKDKTKEHELIECDCMIPDKKKIIFRKNDETVLITDIELIDRAELQPDKPNEPRRKNEKS